VAPKLIERMMVITPKGRSRFIFKVPELLIRLDSRRSQCFAQAQLGAPGSRPFVGR
jgi:hypothetical protein